MYLLTSSLMALVCAGLFTLAYIAFRTADDSNGWDRRTQAATGVAIVSAGVALWSGWAAFLLLAGGVR